MSPALAAYANAEEPTAIIAIALLLPHLQEQGHGRGLGIIEHLPGALVLPEFCRQRRIPARLLRITRHLVRVGLNTAHVKV